MTNSVFELFRIGVGPSSSHTIGPTRAAAQFVARLSEDGLLPRAASVGTELYGSLALTGAGPFPAKSRPPLSPRMDRSSNTFALPTGPASAHRIPSAPTNRVS